MVGRGGTYDNVSRYLTISCQNTCFSTGRVGCLAVQFTLTHDNRYAIGLLTVSFMGDMLPRRAIEACRDLPVRFDVEFQPSTLVNISALDPNQVIYRNATSLARSKQR